MCDPTPKAVLLLPIFSMWEVEEGDGGGGGGGGGERDLKTTTVSEVSKANQCGGIQWASSSFITYFFPALHQWTLALHHGPHTCNQL